MTEPVESYPVECVYWIYILRCSDDSLYTGIARDPDKRLALHNSGKGAKYTRGRGPCSIVYLEQCAGRKAAQEREWALKKLSREAKLALLVAYAQFERETNSEFAVSSSRGS